MFACKYPTVAVASNCPENVLTPVKREFIVSKKCYGI